MSADSVLNAPSRLHEALWSAIPSPALALDADNRILEANPAAELFFAMSVAGLRRRRLEDLAGEGALLAQIAGQARRSAVSVRAYGVSVTLIGLDGSAEGVGARRISAATEEPQIVDVQAAPVHDAPGVTALLFQPRSAASEMSRAAAGQSARRSLSGLAATLAHEIKNPLFGISGAVQLMEPNLSDEDKALAQLVHEEIDRVRALLDRVDAFGELGPIERRPVNIHDVLDQARRAAAVGFGRKTRISDAFDPSLPPVPGDRAQLLQALTNLLKNAVEAAPRHGGEVQLRTAYRPGVKIAGPDGAPAQLPLEVIVADNGPGVPESLQPYIFEPFVTSKGAGAGIGLALVAKIISDHGGVIDYGRRRGRTEFRILLPVWRGEA